jgi:hypothetical protein
MPTESSDEVSGAAATRIPTWRESLFLGLVNAIKLNQEGLLRQTPKASIPEAAWLARNLLELLVWSEYCCKSEQNSYRFYTDVLHDLKDGLNTIEKIANGAAVDTSSIQETRKRLEETAARISMDMDRESYKRVSHAAQDLNKGSWFQAYYKLFSKFAHPTAAGILMPHYAESQEAHANLLPMFLYPGPNFGQTAIRKVVEFMKDKGETIPLEMEERMEASAQLLQPATTYWEDDSPSARGVAL